MHSFLSEILQRKYKLTFLRKTAFTWNLNAYISITKLSFDVDSSKGYLSSVYYVLGSVLDTGGMAATRAKSLLSQGFVSAGGVRQ